MAQQIRLNMAPGSLPEAFHVSQGDAGRELTAVLEDGGTAFVVPPGATAKLVGTKPSGLGFQITATCAGNIVTIVTETTMTNEHGRIPAEIRLTDANGLRIGTANVVIDVEPDPHPDNTTDGDAEELVNEITELLHEIEGQADRAETAEGKAEDAQEAAETAQGKAEDAQGKAEDAQEAAETAQGKAEDAQEAAETARGKAEDAKEAAETAQGKAETAQGKAEDAQEAAETAQGKAETAQGKAEDAQEAAETARGKAEDAKEAAERSAREILYMTVSSETLEEGSTATVQKEVIAGVYNLDFGIPKGDTGNGIASAELNSDYTLTLTFTDGTSYTTPSIRGEQGPQGPAGRADNLGLVVVDGALCYNWIE